MPIVPRRAVSAPPSPLGKVHVLPKERDTSSAVASGCLRTESRRASDGAGRRRVSLDPARASPSSLFLSVPHCWQAATVLSVLVDEVSRRVRMILDVKMILRKDGGSLLLVDFSSRVSSRLG